jgi:hypothetical protein
VEDVWTSWGTKSALEVGRQHYTFTEQISYLRDSDMIRNACNCIAITRRKVMTNNSNVEHVDLIGELTRNCG